jgi:hypothetical protein
MQPPTLKQPEQPALVPPTGPLQKLQIQPNMTLNHRPPTMPPQ